MLPDFRNSFAFWKVPRLHPFVLLVKDVDEEEYVSEMMLTGDDRSNRLED